MFVSGLISEPVAESGVAHPLNELYWSGQLTSLDGARKTL
jgi:hypothetical protein